MDLRKNSIKHNFKFAKFFLICIKIKVYQSIFYGKNKSQKSGSRVRR